MNGRSKLVWTLALVLVAPALAGCIGDTGEESGLEPASREDLPTGAEALWESPESTPHPAFVFPTYTHVPADAPAWWQPIEPRELPETISSIEHLATDPVDGNAGAGIAIFGQLAIVPGWVLPGSSEVTPTLIFDISDPSSPVEIGELELGMAARDTATIAYPDGRLAVAFATDAGLIPVWNITDPTSPQELTILEPSTNSHNVAVVPGTPILYNANSMGGGAFRASAVLGGGNTDAVTEIYDLTDPREPELVQAFANGYGCHDITFFIDEASEKYRAYCAGLEVTQIWDIADPLEPEIVTNVPFHHGDPDLPATGVPVVSFSHLAMVNKDASVLIVGDETGAGVASYPGCDAYIEQGGQSLSGPSGNLWFYDITDEPNPELLSWISPPAPYADNPPPEEGELPVAPCTAHFGKIVPDPDQDLVAVGFYGAGVVLVDFTDPANPLIVDQWINDQTNVWDVWYYQGYLFTGDFNSGMDVLTLR